MRAVAFFLAVFLLSPLAGNTLVSELRKNGKQVQAALSPVQASLQTSSAVFINNETRLSFLYGTVASDDGYLLTKASELDGIASFSVRVGEKKYREASIVATDEEWDLALVKIEASDLTPVIWGETSDLAHGTWVVSNGATERKYRRPRPGMISANKREILGGSPAMLGLGLKDTEAGVILTSVIEGSGAEKAELAEGDLILEVDGLVITKVEQLVNLIKERNADDSVSVEVKRGEDILVVEVTLTARYKLAGESKSRNFQMSGGGRQVSGRRDSFPMVIQHETALTRRTVGGPLLTFDGKCVGLNIAAVNRVEVFAIPVENLRELYLDLREQADED